MHLMCNIKEQRRSAAPIEKENNMERLDVFKYPVFAMINDVFDLPHRKIKFFRQTVIRDSVNQTPFKQFPVAF